MDSKELGNLGEDLACEYLVKKGLKIVGRNYKLNFGEIDVITVENSGFFSKNGKVIHFIEVKTLRQSGEGFFPEQRVDFKKQQKLKKLAQIWLAKNKISQNTPYQIDIIAVSFDSKNEPKIEFFENAMED